ncbi:acyl-CoA dehydrogenase family protein [Pararhodobacter sp. SW119]|uniref:acyl-CoA dehydrogenase family protein n=1 Tax=Pararhodobacter sp. SW119 TaxID=2780075 RepID=UPI001AE0693E|nr:acyl-CoA dehydrogenase family protein [Pararhodobacter sp. SW119]
MRVPVRRPEAVFADIARRATAADRGESDLRADIAALVESGLLACLTRACLPGGDTLAACDTLRALGRANLSVGRLVEGHVNAIRLIRLYGEPAQQGSEDDAVLHGVWGADADPPVRIAKRSGNEVWLSGRKKFCSGLGVVGRAVVTAATDDDGAPQMLLIDATDPRRAAPGDWQVSGMRATASGSYDLSDHHAVMLGQPGDLLREPHFEGGIWRYLALHTGGLEALAEGVRRMLGERAAHPLHAARLVDLVIAAEAARLWLEAAALAIEAPRAGAQAVSRVLMARQAIDAACQQAIALSERSVGAAAFAEGNPIDRVRRDLAFFLRQADLDGKMLRVAAALAPSEQVVGEMW